LGKFYKIKESDIMVAVLENSVKSGQILDEFIKTNLNPPEYLLSPKSSYFIIDNMNIKFNTKIFNKGDILAVLFRTARKEYELYKIIDSTEEWIAIQNMTTKLTGLIYANDCVSRQVPEYPLVQLKLYKFYA